MLTKYKPHHYGYYIFSDYHEAQCKSEIYFRLHLWEVFVGSGTSLLWIMREPALEDIWLLELVIGER